jgi:hypothetical protein
MGWPYRLEDVEKTVEYVFKKYMESPLIQRWLGLNAAAVAGAADARLAAAQLRNASLLIGAADLALTLGVPLAVWVGVSWHRRLLQLWANLRGGK